MPVANRPATGFAEQLERQVLGQIRKSSHPCHSGPDSRRIMTQFGRFTLPPVSAENPRSPW